MTRQAFTITAIAFVCGTAAAVPLVTYESPCKCRVVELRAEEDGDLHIALADASGDKPGMVVAEIPAKAEWCELRKIVFGWTEVQFPFRVRSGRKLKLTQPPVITVIGKAFFDIGHAPADHSNRRTDLQGYAAWEIHPVMKIAVND